jgi:predicted nucleic acid-binding protein
VKLIVNERETRALRAFLRGHPLRLTSRVATVEVSRTVARHSEAAITQLPTAFKRVALIEMSAEVAAAAADLAPAALRTLDAIHLASAQSVGAELAAFVTYDARLAEAAGAVGLRVESPA